MYIETSASNYGQNVFCSSERTDIIHLSKITFYYNRFSAGNFKARGGFRLQLLLEDNTRSTPYNIRKMIDIVFRQMSGLCLV